MSASESVLSYASPRQRRWSSVAVVAMMAGLLCLPLTFGLVVVAGSVVELAPVRGWTLVFLPSVAALVVNILAGKRLFADRTLRGTALVAVGTCGSVCSVPAFYLIMLNLVSC